MLKAYANSPEMQKRYLELNAFKKAHILKDDDGFFCLFMTGDDETIGIIEFSAKRKADVLQYWNDCNVTEIVLDTKTR